MASRLLGLVRSAVVTNFLGLGPHADVLQAAIRAPNFLQNLLGEGTISAAFIPVYSRMLKQGRAEDAGRFAGAIFSLLVVLVAALVILGILLARPLVGLLFFKWAGDAAAVAAGTMQVDRLALTVDAVQIVFPMAGLLVLSAWALGILNSHRKFFIPYFAPVLWNVAIIVAIMVTAAAVVGTGATVDLEGLKRILFAALTGALAGGLLQLLVQVPWVLRVMRGFRLSLSTRVEGVRTAIRAFGPAVAGRGVSQLSAYVDLLLAQALKVGALAALGPALLLYLLPVSLFGLSVAAAELPELARLGHSARQRFALRLGASLRQSMFLTIPTAVGYVAVGFFLVGAIWRRGAFGLDDNYLVWAVLAAYSLGLVATTMSRLLQNAFWALGDTRTPAWMAGLRVVLSALVALPLMLLLDPFEVGPLANLESDSSPLFLGAVGLGLGSAAAAWVEWWQLIRALRKRLAAFVLPWRPLAHMVALALLACAFSLALAYWLPAWPIMLRGGLVVGIYALVYLAAARLLGIKELGVWAGQARAW